MSRYLRVRIDDATEARLDEAVSATGRSASELVRHAISTLPVVTNRAAPERWTEDEG